MTAVARGAFGASKATALNFQPMPAMQEFLDQLVAEGRSASHIRTCRAALHYLTENMRTQNVYVPQDITRQHLVLFQGWMNSQPWKSSYKIELLKKVKHWLSWLVNVRYLRDTPWNKGGTFKTLPYLDDIKNSWRRYETWRVRHAKPDELAAFINRGGTRMRPSDVWEIVHDLGERAGVRVNPHRFRDTCATRLLDEDVAVERVAQILGHKNIKTTLGYGKVNDHKVAEALNSAMGAHINGLIFGKTKDLVTP
jgi:site-specific recombinase XerD